MIEYACECGAYRGFLSVQPEPCDTCGKCGTVLTPVGEEFPEPEPHAWVKRYHPETGKAYRKCLACKRREGWEEASRP